MGNFAAKVKPSGASYFLKSLFLESLPSNLIHHARIEHHHTQLALATFATNPAKQSPPALHGLAQS
jgi:hypothetical protein